MTILDYMEQFNVVTTAYIQSIFEIMKGRSHGTACY